MTSHIDTLSGDGVSVIRDVITASAPRPLDTDDSPDKNKYAIRFADKMAELIVRDLSSLLKGIEATTKRNAGSVH